jgi:hypothetical protein
MATEENPQSPPSSAEEAAALLGAAISFGDAPLTQNESCGHPNPPAGMHSIFAVQSPVPNGVLFVRLCNLREWLRWHAGDETNEDGVEDVSISSCVCYSWYHVMKFGLNFDFVTML